MARIFKTPLAWKNLTHDPRRLGAAVCGIGFAVLLMFVQVGFQNALYDSQVRLLDKLEGEVFIVSSNRFAIAAETRFPIQKLYQARSTTGVASACPLYTELTASVFKNFAQGKTRKGYQIRSLGVDVDDPVFKASVIGPHATALRAPMTALIDRQSDPEKFGDLVHDPQKLAEASVELSGERLNLVGTFDLGKDFVHEGNLVMHTSTFARLFPQRARGADPLSAVDIGVIFVNDDADPREVRRALSARLGDAVSVYTRDELIDKEKSFWYTTTPIGAVFSAGKIIGFVVGVVICYQVIFTGISDHMAEFATLKAMGYSQAYFLHLIIVEAVWLAVFGFAPGALVSWGLYEWLAGQTGLLMQMTASTLAFVFGATVAMCIASGLLAVRKLLTADPASLF